MSLVRLLTSGKSLVGFQDTPSSYRFTRRRLLPQFGPARNPFGSKGKSNGGPVPGPSPQHAVGESAAGTRRVVPGSGGVAATAQESGTRDRRVFARVGAWSLPEGLQVKAAALFNAGGAKLSGWFGAARSKVARPAIARFTKQPVQGELSLDMVRVVRNDLSETDLEIVPARPPAVGGKPAPAQQHEAKASNPQSRWGRIASRIFGAGKA